MCGIAGILKFNGGRVDMPELKRMTDSIAHRGPDGEGQWINQRGTIGFGHRRLSILDLSDLGKQPMHYADGRYTITFNGEIYNYIEIKEELLKHGYRFFSNGDTEVLLALYDHKKEKCLQDLDGMFAFAIWDEKEQILFCARDRFGEKPFHYYSDNQRFVFGSEIKELWSAGVEKKTDQERMNAYLQKGQIDDETNLSATFYKNISRLDAAHYLYIQADGTKRTERYWQLNLNAPSFSGTMEQASDQFLSLLTESVRLRLRSDVPVGSSLSGGLDSSSIVMLIDKIKRDGQIQNTFSARFKNFDQDEGKYVEEVAKACKHVQVHYTWPDENYFLDVLDKVSFHQDEPFGSASIVAQYAVMELAKKNNVTVLLDGQGADEYLAGYLPYYKTYLNQLFYNNRARYSKELRAFNAFHGQVLQYDDLGKSETITMRLGRYKRKLLNQPMPSSDKELKKQLSKDTTVSGLKELLRYADRNSMAHSREVRLPFLSHKLVEFSFSLPDAYKLNMGWTKYVLRKSMDPILPKDITWRKDKIGYASPQSSWLNSAAVKNEITRSGKLFDVTVRDNNPEQNWRLLIAGKYA